MDSDRRDFEAFMKTRESAARAYASGDAQPVSDLSTRISPASFFSPTGGATLGAPQVGQRYVRDAATFSGGGETHFQIVQSAASDTLAFWTGFQHASVHFAGKPEPVSMKLRVTEIFRREDDGWKLIHRHADALGAPAARVR